MTRTETSNPFRFSAPLERADDLVGRDAELAALERLARAGTYTLLEAPRRYGKTSLLKAAALRWREPGNALAVWVDYSAVLTIDEAARRLEDAYVDPRAHGGLSDLLRELVASVRLRLGPLELAPQRGGTPPELDPAASMHRLLEIPVEVAHRTGHRALVTFDEFQDVLSVPGLDGLMRSHIQHHAEHVTYVFAGSEPTMLTALFADRARPLYGQAKPMALPPIAPDLLADSIARRFEHTGRSAGEGGQAVASLGAGHPQRTMLLAWQLWELTPPGEVATLELAHEALAQVIADRRPELDATWRALSTVEQRVAVAVAHGLAPSGSRAQRATGIRNRSAAGQAANSLVAAGQMRRDSDGHVALVDPLFASYLRNRHPLPVGSWP
ncbi:MAG: AAA family ATPase [Solirubrobacteraceae bacterium]